MNLIDREYDDIILKLLLTNSQFFTEVYSFITPELFKNIENIDIFKCIRVLYNKNENNKPTIDEVAEHIKLKRNATNEKIADLCLTKLNKLKDLNEDISYHFLVSNTEDWIKNRSMLKIILEGAEVIEKKGDMSPIYEKLGEALSITFDKDLGLKSDNIKKRLEQYTKITEASIKTGVKLLDDKLGGGFYPKTLNVVAAVTHGGKSLMLSHICAYNFKNGKNGVYITLEMSEIEIWKRIDANILEKDINTSITWTLDDFKGKYNSDSNNKLFVKEFGAGECSVLNIKKYLNDLFISENNFTPDFICIDYLTIMKSSRVTAGKVPAYQYPKYIAEELHAYSKKIGIPIITAAQLNRAAFGNIKSGISDVADSIGISQTADIFFTLNRSEELDKAGQIFVNISKNRNSGFLGDFTIGINFNQMLFYDIEQMEAKDREININNIINDNLKW